MRRTMNQKALLHPYHSQANRQVEIINKIIKYTLKRKFDALKGAWDDELPQVLWPLTKVAGEASTWMNHLLGREAWSHQRGPHPFSLKWIAHAFHW